MPAQRGGVRPMMCAEVRRLKPKPAKAKQPGDLVTPIHGAFLEFPKGVNPGLSTHFEQVASSAGTTLWKLKVAIPGVPVRPGRVVPQVEKRAVSRSVIEEARGPLVIEPYRPDFVALNPIPKKARLGRRRALRRRDGSRVEPLYVFPPDGRYVYNDHNYPWRCVGQVNNNGRISTGVLVGPRHVLTASHALDWNAPWAVFGAHHYGTFNLAVGYTWCVWYHEKLGAVDSETVDEDYVVLVLDEPIGNSLGWFGSHTYLDDWDDEPYFAHCGYASDLNLLAEYPTYQADISLEEEDGGLMKAMSTETGDFTQGHSGGPVFAWIDGVGPYAVGVVSGEGQGKNWVSGGTAMVRLIKQALAETP